MISVKRIVTVFSATLLALACGVALLSDFSGLGWKTFSIPTGSMRPTIPPGSLVLMHSASAKSLKVGDVITYADPLDSRKTITHRIIKTYMIGNKVPGFVTKGDANPSPDIPISAGSVRGKITCHVPDVGGWLMWSKTWTGIAILIYLPALLIIVEEIRRLSDYYRLSLPYKLYGFRRESLTPPSARRRYATASGIAMLTIVLCGALFWQPAFALLHSNTVALAPNNISVAASQPPPSNCSNNTNINVNNSSTQTATTGSASSSDNTNGGSASSGNASNSNSTNIGVTVTNSC